RAIARGGYARHRVFFLTEADARAAGYRPCAVCLPQAYAAWKKSVASR
ncbi:Ada metal-binding domain-containing protein, partial [Ralstonia pseudosolanacearum]